MHRTFYFVIIGLLLRCVFAMHADAAMITVTNTNDGGPGSLRQALRDAHDGDTINFVVSGTITLTSGGLPINKNIAISGPGADQLSIDGNQGVLVFGIFPGRAAIISGLTAKNAQSGILNDGIVAVINCVLSDNSYDGLTNYGMATVSSCVLTGNSYDGVYSYEGETTINNSVITGNAGGGLFNDGYHGPNKPVAGYRSITIADSIISDNSETGVLNYGDLMVLNSALSGNSTALDGGAIASGTFKTLGSVTVISSTINGNSASGGGGGIQIYYGGLTIVNSTISGNSAADGGGIANYSGGVQVANSTLSGNSAPADFGGGIINAGTVEIGNTIFNAGASGENIFNNGGTVTSNGYNISSDDGGGVLTGPGDQINTDPLLGPLWDHGGPTLTHMPLRGSPAIDAGNPEFTPPPDHDQRGSCFYRVFGSRIDIGSVETQPRPPCVTPALRPTP